MDLIERLINKDYLTERERKEWLGTIKERLEVLENENKELNNIIEKYNDLNIQSFFIRDREREEIKQLKKALEKACKILSWDCPCCQDLIDDLDCENRCQPDIDYAECWKKYFLKEVLGE